METWLIVTLVAVLVILAGAGAYLYYRSRQPAPEGFEAFTAGVADYFLTNDYWSNHYWSFDYWPAYGTAVSRRQRRMHIYEEPIVW